VHNRGHIRHATHLFELIGVTHPLLVFTTHTIKSLLSCYKWEMHNESALGELLMLERLPLDAVSPSSRALDREMIPFAVPLYA
jgi:hypothetical protein